MSSAPDHARALMAQASGLRRLFSREQVHFVPVVAHPYVARSSVPMDQLCQAMRSPELSALVVDASRAAGAGRHQPRNRSRPAAERLAPPLGYLDVEMLDSRPARVGPQQAAQAFLHEVADTMPDADVVLVHATTPDLLRLFSRRRSDAHAPRFVLVCDGDSGAVTPRYAALQSWIARGHVAARKVVMSTLQGTRATRAMATRLLHDAHRAVAVVQRHARHAGAAHADSDAGLPAMYRLTEELLAPARAPEPPARVQAAAARRRPIHAQFS